jgi:hypothetical protein
MKSKKPLVQRQAFSFQNTGDNLTACFLKALYTLSVNFAVVIPRSDDHSFDPHFYDQIGTGRCFPVMRTGFQVDIKHRFPEELPVLHRPNGYYFRMELTCSFVPTLTKDPVLMHNNSTNQRIRIACTQAIPRQLYASIHKKFVSDQ